MNDFKRTKFEVSCKKIILDQTFFTIFGAILVNK